MAKKKKRRTKQQVLRQLSSVKGIGKKLAEAIYDRYKTDAVSRLIDDPTDAAEHVAGLSIRLATQAGTELARLTAEVTEEGVVALRYLSSSDMVKQELARNWERLYQQRRYAELVLSKHRRRLLARPDICGVHVGLWRSSADKTQAEKIVWPLQYCIRVHVPKKAPTLGSQLVDALMPTPIEKFIDGVKVDVLEQHYRSLTGELPRRATKVSDPIRGGVPIAPSSSPTQWGTLGKVVYGVPHGKVHFLTNAHVAGNVGEFIQQPASEEADDKIVIGKVVRSVRSSKIDAAVIEPIGKRKWDDDIVGPEGGGELDGLYVDGTLTKLDEKFTNVFKVGAASGFKPILVGTVKNVSATVKIDGKKMTDQILVEADHKIIEPGDSGSVLITRTKKNGVLMNIIVGLVHAETENESDGKRGFGLVASHIHRVKEELQISVT